MAQTYGKSTNSVIDRALTVKSVFAPYFGDNGYKFNGDNAITVLSFDNGTLSGYNEGSLKPAPITLVGTTGNDYTLGYNQAMFARIQKTLLQDTPIADGVAKWARQQIEEVFIPIHDVYSIGKVVAGRQAGQVSRVNVANYGTASSDRLTVALSKALALIKNKGADVSRSVALLSSTFAVYLADQITFTGSDAGYSDAKNNSFLGRLYGVTCVEVPDNYFPYVQGSVAGKYVRVQGVVADKRAVLNVAPKMSPEDFTVIEKVSGFSGPEVQIRDRADTFVLEKKKWAIATIEDALANEVTAASTAAPAYTTATTATAVTQL